MKPRITVLDRARQAGWLLSHEGIAGLSARLRARAVTRLAQPGYEQLPVSREDLFHAAEQASSGWALPRSALHSPGQPLDVAWISVPPHPGVGGHQTMFRMLGALEQADHRCVLYVYDRHGWTLARHRQTVRTGWPSIRAEVRDVADGIDDAHVVFATSWQTAYPALASPAAGARCYFVQDFEPAFYPAGSESLLAEATYRFGFHGIAIGRWLADKLRREYGMATDHFEFGCDLEHYRLADGADAPARAGISYYCRPGTPRRAYELAMMALELFAARRPDVEIHLFGRPAGRVSFRATDHGLLPPARLNGLYNACVAGLSLSATNSSLVPLEMLAAGCIPVVNDALHNRVVLNNDQVVYAPATPFHLADALADLVQRPQPEIAAGARAAAASVRSTTWEQAGAQFDAAVRRVVDRYRADEDLAIDSEPEGAPACVR